MGLGDTTTILVWDEEGVPRAVGPGYPLPTTGGGGGGGAVDSVNGQIGVVVLTATDVDAVATTDVAVDPTDDSVVRRDADGKVKTQTAADGDDAVNKTQFDAGLGTRLGVPTGTGSATTFARGDGTWATPPDTTYTAITQANIENPVSTTVGLVTGQRVAQAIAANTVVAGKVDETDVAGTAVGWVRGIFVDSLDDVPPGLPVDTLVVVRSA